MMTGEYSKRAETWNVREPGTQWWQGKRAEIRKFAVRDALGRFHGATNFRSSIRKVK